MKCFGYDENNQDNLLTLNEVTFQIKPEMLRNLAGFFTKCAIEMENDPSWEHEHLRDYLNENNTLIDIIVYKADD